MSKQEQVLVTVNQPSIHWSTGDYIHIDENINEAWMEEVLSRGQFVDRWLAEEDKTIVQIIPYVVVLSPDLKIFSYQRKGGGEGRLEGKHSIGIGGHINPIDKRKKTVNGQEVLRQETIIEGACREVIEELVLDYKYVRKHIRQIGVMYTPNCQDFDKSKPGPSVHEVHLAVIFGMQLQSYDVPVREEDHIINYKFVDKPTNLEKYENWSQEVWKNAEKIKSLFDNCA